MIKRCNKIFIDYLVKHLTDDKTPVEMKICIMYGIQIDSRLPYVYLDKISDANGIMENEQYHLTLQELEKNGTINKVDYITVAFIEDEKYIHKHERI